MTTLALGIAGAVVGGAVGSPGMGFVLGTALGRAILGGHTSIHLPTQYGSRLSDLKVQSGQWGLPIPRVYGTYRIAGNVIWSTSISEHAQTFTQTQYVPGGKGGHHQQAVTQSTVSYTYFASFAIALCQGPIAGIRQIWADGKRLSVKPLTIQSPVLTQSVFAQSIRFYKGSEDQMPDPFIEAHQGVDNTPAFRGLAYIVFEGFALADFGNRIPNFSFEVVQGGWQSANHSALPIANYSTDKNHPLGYLVTVSSGLIQCPIGASQNKGRFFPVIPVPPQRVDFDRRLHEIQRVMGINIKPQQLYHAVIKGMPNLFVTSTLNPNQWYDLQTGQHQIVLGQNVPVHCGVYAGRRLYVITGQAGVSYSLRIYAIESPYSLPGELLKEIMLNGNLLNSGEHIADIDYQQGILFGIEAKKSQLIAFDPIQCKALHAWTLTFLKASFSFNPHDQMDYKLSVHPTEQRALITRSDHKSSQAFQVHWDFSQTKLVAEALEIETIEGHGGFSWIDDHHIFASSALGKPPISLNLIDGYEACIYDLNLKEPQSPSLKTVIIDILNQAHFPMDAVDVSELENTIVPGFVISQPSSSRDTLTLLQQAYDLEIVEIGFQLVFKDKHANACIEIPEDAIGAHEVGQAGEDLKITYLEPIHFSSTLNLLFSDRHHDYQQGHVSVHRKDSISLRADTIELPFAFTTDEAFIIAEQLLESVWQKRILAEFTLPRSYVFLNPGNFIQMKAKIWQITEKTYGDPGLVQVKAQYVKDVHEQLSTKLAITKDLESRGGYADQSPLFKKLPQITIPSPTQCFFIELDLLIDKPDEKQWYAILSGMTKDWSGSTLMASIDQGESFFSLFHQNIGATYGWAQSVLTPVSSAPVPQNPPITSIRRRITTVSSAIATETNHALYTLTSVSIKLTWGELSSVSEEALQQGANRCLLGDEVLQFQTATLQADGSYLLENLIRGQCHTETAMNQHQVGERFIMIDPTTWHLLKPPTTMSTLPRYYKAVTDGQLLQDARTQILPTEPIKN